MIESLPPDEVRRITQQVLKDTEFQKAFDVWNLLFEVLRNFLGRVSQWAEQNPDMARILMIVLSAVLALLIAHIAYTSSGILSDEKFLISQDARSRPLQALEGIATNWADAFQLAKAALDAGDLYRALWITHRVLLSALDRLDVLRFARWKTNTDYLRECRIDHAAAKTLRDVSAAYERVIYAHGNVDREQAANLLMRVEAVVDEAVRDECRAQAD
jgi:hypothetical protein